MLSTVARLNARFTRPFRERVDIATVALLLALLLVAAGGWHLVLERLELERLD